MTERSEGIEITGWFSNFHHEDTYHHKRKGQANGDLRIRAGETRALEWRLRASLHLLNRASDDKAHC